MTWCTRRFAKYHPHTKVLDPFYLRLQKLWALSPNDRVVVCVRQHQSIYSCRLTESGPTHLIWAKPLKHFCLTLLTFCSQVRLLSITTLRYWTWYWSSCLVSTPFKAILTWSSSWDLPLQPWSSSWVFRILNFKPFICTHLDTFWRSLLKASWSSLTLHRSDRW